jgi:hypothetical protein
MTTSTAEDLRTTVAHAVPRLRALPSDAAAKPRAPGKWSPKQIIGHLIDSATNNHGRFVRAQLRDSLEFDGYEQAEWVEVQKYADAPWLELVDLWTALNRHIARVIENAGPEARSRLRHEHGLDHLATEAVPADEPATLEYFMRDYVGHLKMHLRQIDESLADAPVRQRSSRRPS